MPLGAGAPRKEEEGSPSFLIQSHQEDKFNTAASGSHSRPRLQVRLAARAIPGLHPAELQREVLRDEVVGVEQHDNVDLELHFEVGGLQRRAGEQPGKTMYMGTERLRHTSPSAIWMF